MGRLLRSACLAAGLLGVLTALGSCGGLAGGPGGGRRSCVHNGSAYPYGSTFLAGDDCNTCSCEEDGEVVCTRSYCINCDTLPQRYAEALLTAKSCDPRLRVEQCTTVAANGLRCGCPTYVNDDSELNELADEFQAQGCAEPITCGSCPDVPIGGHCASDETCSDVHLGSP